MADPKVIEFKRGTTFSFAVNIPSGFPDKYFAGWEVHAQVRKPQNSMPSGLVAVLGSHWSDDKTRKLFLFDPTTDKWPIGDLEMDVLFISSTGYKIRSKTIIIKTKRGITI